MIYHTSLGTLFLRAYAVYEGKRIVTVILLSSALVNHPMKLPIACSLFFSVIYRRFIICNSQIYQRQL